MSIRWLVAAVAAAGLAAAVIWGGTHAPAAGGATTSGAAATASKALSPEVCDAGAKPANLNFTLKDVNGADVSLASFTGKVIVLDFWATWCGPCKQLGPVLDQLATEMGAAVQICKVDVDSNPALAQNLGVTSIPALFLFKNGVVVDKIVGARPKGDIAAFIKKHSA